MSDEGKNDVEEIQPDKDGEYPETVPWSKYVGIKESLGKKADTAITNLEIEKQKVTSLEEQIKSAASAEDIQKLKDELTDVKGKLQSKEEELTNLQNSSVAEKREVLTKRGVPEDKIKDMTAKELDAAIMALGSAKPAPDLGGGGGSGDLKGSPIELAVKAYTK